MVDTLTPVLTANWGAERSWTLASYEEHGGYAGLRTALGMAPDDVIAAVKDSGLRGRGGAGFTTAVKWDSCRQAPVAAVDERVVICNADEGEPGTFKDRHCLDTEPHRLLEGVLIAAWASW